MPQLPPPSRAPHAAPRPYTAPAPFLHAAPLLALLTCLALLLLAPLPGHAQTPTPGGQPTAEGGPHNEPNPPLHSPDAAAAQHPEVGDGSKPTVAEINKHPTLRALERLGRFKFDLRPDINLAPFYERETTKHFQRVQILGPLYEHTHLPDGRDLKAIRPFWSRYIDPKAEYFAQDWAWPLLVNRIYYGQYVSRGFMGEEVDPDIKNTPNGEHSFWYPFYFKGTSRTGEPYFAFFPFYGSIHDFFGYDRLTFKWFPYYMQTERVGITATHRFFPIYARVDGPNIHKHRVWPFYGYMKRKNWESRFWAWPFLHKGRSLNPDRPGSAFFFFPFYGRMSFKDLKRENPVLVENRTFLWPFFNGYRTHKDVRLYMPWPFIQYQHSFDDKERMLYLWPIWGTKRTEISDSRFFLWPLFFGFREQRAQGVIAKRLHINPFYWHNFQTNADGSRHDTFWRIWPFMSYHKSEDAATTVRVLDIWPMRNAAPVERNQSPFWTFYTYRDVPAESLHTRNLLWGLYQYRKRDDQVEKRSLFPFFSYSKAEDTPAKRLDILTGIYGRETTDDGEKHTRLLWFFKF